MSNQPKAQIMPTNQSQPEGRPAIITEMMNDDTLLGLPSEAIAYILELESRHPLGRAGDGGAELEFGGLKVRVDPTMPPDAVRFETPIPRAVPQGELLDLLVKIRDLSASNYFRITDEEAAALIQQYADVAVAEIKQTLPYFHETQRLRKEADALQAQLAARASENEGALATHQPPPGFYFTHSNPVDMAPIPLADALKDAIECIESWGAYASEYFQDKHDLQGDINRLEAILAAHQAAQQGGE